MLMKGDHMVILRRILTEKRKVRYRLHFLHFQPVMYSLQGMQPIIILLNILPKK